MPSIFRPGNRRGITLLVSVVFLMICALIALMLFRNILNSSQLETHRRELTRAFHAAEGGVHEVVDWFNHPDQYTPDSDLFEFDEINAEYTNLENALANGDIVVPNELLPNYDSADSKHLGRVTGLTLTASNSPGVIARVISSAVSFRNVDRTVEMDLYHLDPLFGEAPAALVTRGNIVTGGNVQVYWGEAWSRYSLNVPAKNKMDILDDYDPDGNGLVNFRSVENLVFDVTWKDGGSMDWYNLDPLNPQPCFNFSNPAQAALYGPRFYQYQPTLLDLFPNYPYEEYKDFAMHRGAYYGTDADGNLYRDGVKDSAHQVDWDTEFTTVADQLGDWTLIFVDTIDSQAPNGSAASATTNLATIPVSGSVPHTRGMFYVNANLKITGTGNPPDLTVEDPTTNNSTTELDKVMHHGLLVVNGKLIDAGNMTVFGSVYVDGNWEDTDGDGVLERVGFSGTGTPTVYYDRRLKDGFPQPLTSRVVARLWRIH